MTDTRRIADMDVHPIGLGCMGLSHGYGPPVDLARSQDLLLGALDEGVTLFDTAALYGFGLNETLVGDVLSPFRSRFTLASKCGIFQENGQRTVDGRPATIQRTCEDALRRLRTDVIDLYYLHRWDTAVPIEDSVGAMADLVRQGKVRHIGLSEVSAPTLRKAHAVHPIAAVQSEYSLWTRNPEIAVLQACRDIGAAFVAFSPLGRAFLADGLHDVSTLAEDDMRRRMPRFAPDAWTHNLTLLAPFRQLAAERDCSPAQLALAWVLHQGNDIIALPGTTQLAHLRENMAAAKIHLDAATCTRLDDMFARNKVRGGRYNEAAQKGVDTEQFPDR